MKIVISYTETEAMQAANMVQQLRNSLPPTRVKTSHGEKYKHYYILTKLQKLVDESRK